jgi:hypothetical protein
MDHPQSPVTAADRGYACARTPVARVGSKMYLSEQRFNRPEVRVGANVVRSSSWRLRHALPPYPNLLPSLAVERALRIQLPTVSERSGDLACSSDSAGMRSEA